jgi:hypothetical protein
MSSSPVPATGWDELFRTLDSYLKAFAAQQWPLQDDGSGSEVYLSIHGLYGAFPVPVDIVLLDASGVESQRKQGDYATAIRYDFSKPNTPNVRFHGIVPLPQADAHAEQIESLLGIPFDSLEALKDLRLTFIWGAPLCTHIVPYDARTQALEYCGELARQLSYSSQLSELFSPKIDYNAKYSLQPDLPMTDEELLQADELNRAFVRISDLKPETLADRHASIAGIHLIPQVPEGVRRTFNLAKWLYVYGHLKYGFFTVSLHYAHLALDAALHARWSATLPASVLLTLHKKKKVEKQETMLSPSHMKIRNFCKISGWRVALVQVDGRPFPFTVNMVIDELAAKGLLSKWQRRMIQEVDVEIRNSLTHLEFAPIHGPSAHDLELTAHTINGLFDSLPTPAKPVSP